MLGLGIAHSWPFSDFIKPLFLFSSSPLLFSSIIPSIICKVSGLLLYLSGYGQSNPFLGSPFPTILSSHQAHSIHLHWFSSLFQLILSKRLQNIISTAIILFSSALLLLHIQMHSIPRFFSYIRDWNYSQHFQGPSLVLTFCGLSTIFECNWVYQWEI